MNMGSLRDGSPTDPVDQEDNANSDPPPQKPTSSTEPSALVKSAVDQTLAFLSNASNETLGACLVGLGATTYLVLGRVGLIIIGAVGGVVLHATWESSSRGQGQGSPGNFDGKRGIKEANSLIALRLLEWREAQKQSDSKDDEPIEFHDFAEFQPETGKALNILTDAVIRDYVRWWYTPVLPTEDRFPSTCRQTFTSFLLALSSNLSKKRPADTFLEFVTNSSSIMIVVLNELSTAVSASPLSSPADAIQNYLTLKPESNLSNILDEPQQQRKLQMVANDILENYLDAKVLNCPPARVFLREILANVILDFTLQRCCKSEWVNDWIVYLLEDGEPELLNAIDAGVDESSVRQAVPAKLEEAARASEAAQKSSLENSNEASHKRAVSKAEDAMEEAMREAQRLTQLIAEEDAKRAKERESGESHMDDTSDSTNTHGIQTPASSQGDLRPEETQRALTAESLNSDAAVEEGRNATITVPDGSLQSTEQITVDQPQPFLQDDAVSPQKQPEVLTLHKASFTIFDDATPNDKRPMKGKPTIDYMIQIEPLSSSFGGWMIARTYADFETLHEVLRRISAISGAVAFTEAHGQLPPWRGATKPQLTSELERYLTDAVQFEPLAESEGMKRFLEKSRGMSKSTESKNPFWAGQAAIENVGKGMFDVLSKAPKGVAGGGKAMLGGMTSVLGAGQSGKKTIQSPTSPSASRSSIADVERASVSRDSQEFSNPSAASLAMATQSASARSSTSIPDKIAPSTPEAEPARPETPVMNLPPPPSAIPDDYKLNAKEVLPEAETHIPKASVETTPILSPSPLPDNPAEQAPPIPAQKPRSTKAKAPISEQETQVTIELLFAVINELYTLSSAWNIRRTLLNAAKAYLLRPGNQQLENIRVLLQDSVLDANTSDAGMAAHILKLRENALPTEEELKAWPAPLGEEAKEALRKKARKLLVQRGMPQALTSVMGAAASGEALGKVFDCLQVEQVARGLLFGVMLQAVRAVTQ